MSEQLDKPNAEPNGEVRKITLAEAMKRKLEQKKQASAKTKDLQNGHHTTDVKQMKTQINKKPNNQKRRTGV
ncbi:hypothetical protein [Paenibacillus ginsengarvi]|uniref:Uncharacterized protein n=1 Tax=Paenibacillus ginsengarvi TaxID=400777 RepID=A0A3B0BTS1_9BACL|nr:hypothetical protein [Paenibacillus ginsengarvi]RKN75788.1 hypothetical protein D7M11_25110 [Paenibacillus ginsengarvi]